MVLYYTSVKMHCDVMAHKGPYCVAFPGLLQVEMDITVRSVPDSTSIHVIHFTRRQGDPFAFHRVFRRIQSKLPDLQAGLTNPEVKWEGKGIEVLRGFSLLTCFNHFMSFVGVVCVLIAEGW